ncbi:MAG: hypothetical protein COB23_08895 [Methylophaga sp.]|nr:MAG: hypothetical protein COB23_08895 [Methylophaga sp.]
MRFNGQECLGYTFEKKLLLAVSDQFPLNEQDLLVWLTTLPMLNVQNASKQLQEYLVVLNQTNLANKQRLVMLETLRPTVANLIDMFIRNYSGRVPGLTREGQNIYVLVSDLNKNMAEGYTFLLNEIASSDPNWLSQKKYIVLIERSLFYLTESLHLTYLMYMPKPANIWRLIHNTYRYARQFMLQKILVDDHIVSESDKVTIDFLYKRIILQSMISPDSLRSAQIKAIYQGLSPWLDEILVVSPESAKAIDSVYYINYLSDNGPTSQQMASAEDVDSLWLVDNNRLIERIWQWEETGEIESLKGSVELSNDLLMYLVNVLGVRPKFERDRVEIYGNISVVIGLTNIETILAEQVVNTDIQDDEPDSGDSQNWGVKNNDDVWDLIQYTLPEEKAKSVPVSREQSEIKDELIHHWQFVNKSPHGLGLLCELSIDNLLGIGQLLIFKYELKSQDKPSIENGPQRWLLGTVCWMRAAQTIGGVYAGIQILGGNVRIATFSQQTNSNEKPEIALLLNNQQTEQKTVLLSRNHTISGGELNIKYQHKTYNIQLDDVVWQNDGFSLIQYERE